MTFEEHAAKAKHKPTRNGRNKSRMETSTSKNEKGNCKDIILLSHQNGNQSIVQWNKPVLS